MVSSLIVFSQCNITPSPEKSASVIKNKELQPRFFHNVYFYLKPNLTDEERNKFEHGLIELGTIEELIDYHIGKPAMTPREVVDNSYQYSIITSFKDKSGHDAYQVHPIHENFRNEIEGIVDSVRIYDSLIE
jgi:hypothetical protein